MSRLDAIKDWRKAARGAGYRIDKLANDVGVTERQLERFFLLRHQLAPKKWVDVLRMDDGQRYLRRGFMVKEVAARLKFKHVQDFIHAFERIKGVKPSNSRVQGPVHPATSIRILKALAFVGTHLAAVVA